MGEKDSKAETEKPKEAPWLIYLDGKCREKLDKIIDGHKSSNTTVGDSLKIVESKTSGECLGEQAKIRIRDLHSSYQFMGESYIHGMMDGGAMKEQYYNSIPERIFELRGCAF